jgi:hypothetical protein
VISRRNFGNIRCKNHCSVVVVDCSVSNLFMNKLPERSDMNVKLSNLGFF